MCLVKRKEPDSLPDSPRSPREAKSLTADLEVSPMATESLYAHDGWQEQAVENLSTPGTISTLFSGMRCRDTMQSRPVAVSAEKASPAGSCQPVTPRSRWNPEFSALSQNKASKCCLSSFLMSTKNNRGGEFRPKVHLGDFS